MRPLASVALFAIVCSGGCSFGPKTLERSHGRYAESVRKVETEQLLRQIVLLRYNETSMGLDISSIAAQYELSANAEARPFFIAPNPSNSNIIFRTFTSILPDLQVGGANRPTVSLVPINDGSSVRRYLTPITLDTLVFLTQTGWPVSTILRMWVDRMNGVPNAATASGPPRDAPTDFERFLRATRLLQAAQDKELASVRTDDRTTELGGPFPADAVTPAAAVEAVKAGLEYVHTADGRGWKLVRREKRPVIEVSPGAEAAPELVELAGLLNLTPGRKSYDIGVSVRDRPDPALFPTPPQADIRIDPRSTAQVAYFLSNGVEVPGEHQCAGLVRPVLGPDGTPFDPREITRGLFAVRVCKGHKPPAEAFAAVRYRGHWFYIDERDQESKTTFSLLFHLSRLDFARQQLGGPALTLPVGR